MLIPCFFFHRFCLVGTKADWVEASFMLIDEESLLVGTESWIGVKQGLFAGPSNQYEWG